MPITELYDIDWRETSFVPAGDNPPARIVMWKQDPGLTAAELEEILAGVESGATPANPAPTSKEGPMPTMTKRTDVEAEATRRARELQKQHPETYGGKSLAAVRSAVYAGAPELREALSALPAGEPPAAPESPVHKAAEPFSRIDAAAKEELPDLYRRSPSMARSEIAKARPDLQADYHRGHGAQ